MTANDIPAAEPDRAPARETTKGPFVPLVLVVAGIVLLAAIALAQEHRRERLALSGAVLVSGEPPPWPGALQVRLRTLPPPPGTFRGRLLAELETQPHGEAAIHQLGLRRGARAAFVELDPAFGHALASGRLPEPGKPEVLAGDLAADDTVVIPPVAFQVVGRLEPGTPVFANTYVIPAHPHFRALFSPGDLDRTAWLDVQGRERLREMLDTDPGAIERMGEVEATVRMQPPFAIAGIGALMLMAVGGSLSQYRFLRRVGSRNPYFFLRRVLVDWAERPRLAFFIHAALYGVFFAAMTAAVAWPRLNLQMYEWTRYMFSEGDLGYVGAAYGSGSILAATAATFLHNYAVATVLTGMLPSLIFPFWAFLKNMVSFGLAGFVLAPLWADSVAGYTYHGITMILELEAYVVASFAAVMLVVHLGEGVAANQPGAGLRRGVAGMATAIVLAGIMLAIAALYEATTLILLGGG